MGIAQIENPGLAFNSAGQDNTPVLSDQVMTLLATATITKGQICAITYSSSTGEYSVAPAAVSTTADFTGVAADAAISGQTLRVVVHGVALVLSGASIAAGAVFSCGAGGKAAAASATIGSNSGIMMEAASSGSTLFHCFVGKM